MTSVEHPLAAVYRAIRQRLTGTDEIWGERVHYDIAPAGTARPHVVFNVQSAAEENRLRKRDALVVMQVKVISTNLAEALTAAARVAALLNDAGEQDSSAPVWAGSDWHILTITLERMVQFSEFIDGVQVYHAGGLYRIRMEV